MKKIEDLDTLRKVSVIICTRNHAGLLPRIIGNLRVQNYPNQSFEIIVVDNASADETKTVVGQLAEMSDVPIRYVLEERPGITFARNRGAERALYPHLAYVDDDCSVEPDWISQLMRGFEIDEKVMVVGGRVIMDFDDQTVPTWLGPMSYGWLAAYDYPCSEPCLMENRTYVIEGNMAITKLAWKSLGGFLGMDQFGNPHVSANESMYLLEQAKRRGGKIAFVPQAIEYHHKLIPSLPEMLKRAFWNGVSAGILDNLLDRHSGPSIIYQVLINLMATLFFFFLAAFYLILLNQEQSTYYLLKAIRRTGLALTELRIVGDWKCIRTWRAAHP